MSGDNHLMKNPIIIIGGSNLVAPYLIRRMKEEGLEADVISRSPLRLPDGFNYVPSDMLADKSWHAPRRAIVISLIPLEVLARNLVRFSETQSIIALSSTNRFSKACSKDPAERAQAENIEMAENILRAWCLRNGTVFTILRPTLIYDGKNDNSVTLMARIIRRAGMFPVAPPAEGLRQPIHADDVAKAIMGALGNAGSYNKELNIAGGEVLTFRRMVETIFLALGRKPRLLPLPSFCLGSMLALAKRAGLVKVRHISPETFRRMNSDQIYDTGEGLRLLRYSPRKFEPELLVAS